jgi:hypothetical protein
VVARFFNIKKKNIIMKSSRTTVTKQSKQGNSHKPVPEIRDNLDSRKEKERGYKGDKSKKGDRIKGDRNS